MRNLLSTAAIGATLALGCITASAETCNDIQLDAAGDYSFRFPKYMGNLELYDQGAEEDPRMGFYIKYRAAGIFVDVFLDNHGITDIPDGIDSEIMRTHYEEVKSHLHLVDYKTVEVLGETRISFGSGAIPVMQAKYRLQTDEMILTSYILLTAKYRTFIKVRFSILAEKQEEAAGVIEA